MKHVTVAEKTIFMGDDAADSLIEYARLLADNGRADTVTLTGIGGDGNTVEVAFLLNAGTSLVIESTNSDVEPPGNEEAVRYMNERIDRLVSPPAVRPEESTDGYDYDIAGFTDIQ